MATCLICGVSEDKVRLVRDHNHETGYIRGLLCDDCNKFLGIYESKRNAVAYIDSVRRIFYRTWVSKFEPQIKEHLARNTGELYVDWTKIPFKKKPRKSTIHIRRQAACSGD